VDASSPFSETEKAQIQKGLRYASYTYPIIALQKEDVDKVNACFLNEVTECITFRHPPAMIRTIRQWRKSLRASGFLPNLLPPSILPSHPDPQWSSVEEFVQNTLQHLDVNQFFWSFDYLDELEKELTKRGEQNSWRLHYAERRDCREVTRVLAVRKIGPARQAFVAEIRQG